MDLRCRKLLEFFPEPLRASAAELLERRGSEVEEFRFRRDAPIGVLLLGREITIRAADRPLLADGPLLGELLRRATKNSAYAVQNQIREGFLTLPGGHRMGVCGCAVCERGEIRTIREIQSLCLRISHERIGAADPCMNLLWSHPGSALIHGSPGSGKRRFCAMRSGSSRTDSAFASGSSTNGEKSPPVWTGSRSFESED